MADTRQRAEWERTAFLTAHVLAIVGNKVGVNDLMPARYRPDRAREPARTAEQLERDNVNAWVILGAFLGG